MMNKTFPHLGNNDFPGTNNINVYAYQNNFDYTRWQPDVKIKLCNVPWCSNYENVPGFETNEIRDEWFNKLNGHSIVLNSETHLLPDGHIKLPVPFDVAVTYNYIAVEFPPPTSAGNPLAYEKEPHILKYFYFISDVKSIAGSTTDFILQRDEWTTYINDCEINYMMLERGHYPMSKITPEEYLKNPIENTRYLLAPDVTYSQPRNVKTCKNVVMNDGNMYACISTSGYVAGKWGDWVNANVPNDTTAVTPALPMPQVQGAPSASVFCCKAENLKTLLTNCENQIPQFKQTVNAIFLVSEKLINFADPFKFCGVSCWYISATQKNFELITPKVEDFKYPEKYKHITKLYTSPYAHIELCNENGLIATVKVEDTTGSLDVNAALSLAFPSIKLDAVITGVNGAPQKIKFETINKRSFNCGGDWYKTLSTWDVPTFTVTLDGRTAYDVSSLYNRVQTALSADTAKANADRSADTAKANADRSADTAKANADRSANTAKANADRSADLVINNTALETAAAVTMSSNSASHASEDTRLGNAINQALQAENAGASRSGAELSAQKELAGIGLGTAANTLASAVTGDVPGAVGALASGVVSGLTTGITAAIDMDITNTMIEFEQAKVDHTNNNNIHRTNNSNRNCTENTSTQTQSKTAQAANTASTTKTNASATQSTAKTNASATQSTAKANASDTRNVAYSGISNDRKQGGLNAPVIYGAANPALSTIRPMMISANVVTQSQGDISAAADYMARFVYSLNQQVTCKTYNVMNHFSYWQASDVWCVGANGVPEFSQEIIKNTFLTGVTIWENPDEIGKVSIYDN